MAAHTVESRRQRTPPPGPGVDGRGHTAQGGWAVLGTAVAGFVRDLRRRVYGTRMRYPGTVYDGAILRDRQPTIHRAYYRPAGDNWVNWTAAGPVKPTLHMRQASFREMVGNSASRFPYNPDSPTGGLHTNVQQATPRMLKRYQATPQQRGTRTNRLAASQYYGQSYSQQTTIQGGGTR